MSDKALAEQIGSYVKHHRLELNKTQEELAKDAGISRSTLSLLERGEPVTTPTLIQVLRVLDQLIIFEEFQVNETFSPLDLVKLQKEKRQRASGKSKKNPPENEYKSDW